MAFFDIDIDTLNLKIEKKNGRIYKIERYTYKTRSSFSNI